MVLASLWVAGQGMHLAANSINNLAEGLKEQQVIDILGTPIYSLTYFMDEHLSHYMWHFGVVSLAVLLVWREWGKPAGSATQWGMAITAGLLYGIKCFLIFLEGQTVPLGLPFSLVFTLAILVLGTKEALSTTCDGILFRCLPGYPRNFVWLGNILPRLPAAIRFGVDLETRQSIC